MQEEWQTLPGAVYEVSNYGIIRTIRAKQGVKPEMINGSLWVWIKLRSTYKFYRLDQLVALAYMNGYAEDRPLIHLDGDPLNCELTNLEWE